MTASLVMLQIVIEMRCSGVFGHDNDTRSAGPAPITRLACNPARATTASTETLTGESVAPARASTTSAENGRSANTSDNDIGCQSDALLTRLSRSVPVPAGAQTGA